MAATETNFEDDLANSLDPKILKRNQKSLIDSFEIKSLNELQLEEVKGSDDSYCILRSGKKISVDFKNRLTSWDKSKGKDICIEEENNMFDGSLGWTFKLIEEDVDYIIIAWHEPEELCYIILDARKLEDWFCSNYERYPKVPNKQSYKNGVVWRSSFRIVPIKDIPKEIIFRYVLNGKDVFKGEI